MNHILKMAASVCFALAMGSFTSCKDANKEADDAATTQTTATDTMSAETDTTAVLNDSNVSGTTQR